MKVSLKKHVEAAKKYLKEKGIQGPHGIEFKDGWVVLRYQPANSPAIFYAFNQKNSEILGAGALGRVYKAYRLDKNGKLDPNKVEIIAKVQNVIEQDDDRREKQTKEIKAEADFANRKSIPTLPTFESPLGPIILAKNIKGIDLGNEKGLQPILASLGFKERLEAMSALAASINLVHHTTHSTGSGLLHKDIKNANIRVGLRLRKAGKPDVIIEFDKQQPVPNDFFKIKDNKIMPLKGYKLVLDVYPIDFGLSESKPDEEMHVLDLASGTPNYTALEIFHKKGGTKSDIYSLTPVFISLLGGKNPFVYKDPVKTIYEKPLQPFDFDGVGADFPQFFIGTKNYREDVLNSVIQFLKLMQNLDYNARPSIDQVTRFSVLLLTFVKDHEKLLEMKSKGQNKKEIAIQEAYLKSYLLEMFLLSKGSSLEDAKDEADRLVSAALKRAGYSVAIRPEPETTPIKLDKLEVASIETDPSKLIREDNAIPSEITKEQHATADVSLPPSNSVAPADTSPLIEALDTYIFIRWNSVFKNQPEHQLTSIDDVKNLNIESQKDALAKHYHHFWGSFFNGQSAEEKISAAFKLRRWLDDTQPNKPELTQRDYKALLKSSLGDIISEFNDFLPLEIKAGLDKYQEEENTRIQIHILR